MSVVTSEQASFSMSYPFQEGWFSRGIEELPAFAIDALRAKYANTVLDETGTQDLVSALRLHTSSATALRYTEEQSNLLVLHGEANTQEPLYPADADRDTKKTAIIKQIGIFAHEAAFAFHEMPKSRGLFPGDDGWRPYLDKVTQELGGTRQYGLWVHDGEVTTKELDDIIWSLAGGELQSAYPEASVKVFDYEGATPIKYRLFRHDSTLREFHYPIGRRRRGILDITVKTEFGPQTVHFIKQFRGLIALSLLDQKYQTILSTEGAVNREMHAVKGALSNNLEDDDDYVQGTMDGYTKEQLHKKLEKLSRQAEDINRVTGTVMREAIRTKRQDPPSVCPVDSTLLMTALRPQ